MLPCVCLYWPHLPEIYSFHLSGKYYPVSNALFKFHLFNKVLPDLPLNYYHNHLIVDGLVTHRMNFHTRISCLPTCKPMGVGWDSGWYVFRHFILQYYVLHCLVTYKHLISWTNSYHGKSSERKKKKVKSKCWWHTSKASYSKWNCFLFFIVLLTSYFIPESPYLWLQIWLLYFNEMLRYRKS